MNHPALPLLPPASTDTRPVVWSVAGSDSGGAAGLQADLKAFEAWGVHGCTAVAAITAQHSMAVERADAVPAAWLAAQLDALARDLPPVAVKTGMLGSVENILVLAHWVDQLRRHRPVHLVVDPVLRATTGAKFADDDVLAAYRRELLPRASAITPNRAEAAQLLGRASLRSDADVVSAARELARSRCGAVLITGGDASEPLASDYIHSEAVTGWLSGPRINTRHHHGSGCVFAASLASGLAQGYRMADAAVLAKMATATALASGYAAGQGAGPVRPREGFAQQADYLPRLSPERSPIPTGGAPSFAQLPRPIGLYAIVDSLAALQRVLSAGVRTVQLRIKAPASDAVSDTIAQCVAEARAANAILFINDHWQLALEHQAHGVHLGQEDLSDLPPNALSALREAGLYLGISTHCHYEVARAAALQPSYIAAGPIFPTTTKDMPWQPQGLDNLAYWVRVLAPTPVVAIGGFCPERAAQAWQLGASGVAVLQGLGGVDDDAVLITRYRMSP